MHLRVLDFQQLAEFRNAVRDAVLRAGGVPVLFEEQSVALNQLRHPQFLTGLPRTCNGLVKNRLSFES